MTLIYVFHRVIYIARTSYACAEGKVMLLFLWSYIHIDGNGIS